MRQGADRTTGAVTGRAADRAQPRRDASRSASRRITPLYAQLRPSKSASASNVAEHQRNRLHGAMIEAVARHGYQGASVDEIVALAGVSTKTLYTHFGNKLACFFSTYDLIVRDAVARISHAYRHPVPATEQPEWSAGLCRAFDAFVAELEERPKRARLALEEVLAVGPAALPRIRRSETIFVEMLSQSLARAPGGAEMPPILLRGIVGGIWHVARNRLLAGEPEVTKAASRELLEWVLAYRSPASQALCSGAVAAPRRAGRAADAPLPLSQAARAPIQAASGVEAANRIKMLRAAASIAGGEQGYEGLSCAKIIVSAGTSVTEFVSEFDSVEDCFLAAVELLSAQALARALRAGACAPDWPRSVHRVIERLLLGVAEDPVFARLAFVEVFAVGPAGAARRAKLIDGFAAVLVRHVPAAQRSSALVAEAIVGAVWQLTHHAVACGRPHLLPALVPYASYLTLAPIVGAQRAVAAITAEGADAAGESLDPLAVCAEAAR